MATSIDSLKKHCESQLDLLLRLSQANHSCLEKVVSTQVSAIQGFVHHAAITDAPTAEASAIWLTESRNKLTNYWQACLQDSLDYQHKILAELSRK